MPTTIQCTLYAESIRPDIATCSRVYMDSSRPYVMRPDCLGLNASTFTRMPPAVVLSGIRTGYEQRLRTGSRRRTRYSRRNDHGTVHDVVRETVVRRACVVSEASYFSSARTRNMVTSPFTTAELRGQAARRGGNAHSMRCVPMPRKGYY